MVGVQIGDRLRRAVLQLVFWIIHVKSPIFDKYKELYSTAACGLYRNISARAHGDQAADKLKKRIRYSTERLCGHTKHRVLMPQSLRAIKEKNRLKLLEAVSQTQRDHLTLDVQSCDATHC
jgi:LPS O-antigen subunit length determinant protein (WzzB/FepE family)